MGSECPPSVTINATGFKKFHGVSENPTETIVNNIKEYMKKKGLPKGVILGSCNVLETAGQGAIIPLYQTLQSAINKDSESSNNERTIWVHFGVNSGATRFAIEQQAVNEATFRCPDEMGWKPQKVPIIPSDGAISRVRKTTLPVEEITKALADKGFEVMTSDDAGRFVCNYVYYHSLRFAEQNGSKSLFVHVPLFLTIDEETQMGFAASLLETGSKVSNLLRKPVVPTGKALDGISENEGDTDGKRNYNEKEDEDWFDWENQILEDTVPLVGFVRTILHSSKYENGDRLSIEHEKTIVERLLPYHPECEKKIGSRIDYITVIEKSLGHCGMIEVEDFKELSSSFRYSPSKYLGGSSLKRDQSPISMMQGPVSCSSSPPTRIARERGPDANFHSSFRGGASGFS